MNIIIFIIILLVLVLVHEFGHFFAAKKFGIKVDEFGFGFPPKLFGKKIGETEYTLNALPLGGFVKIYGEEVDEADFLEVGFLDKDEDPEKVELAKRSLINKPKYQQAIVMLAGILANLFLAWILFSFGFMSGLPASVNSEQAGYNVENVNLVVTSVLKESPAEKAGLKAGDKIISISLPASSNSADYIQNPTTEELQNLVARNWDIGINYNRAGKENYVIMKPILAEGKSQIGISMDMIGTAKLPFFTAFWEGLRLEWSMIKGMILGLYTLVFEGLHGKGNFFASVSGPVGMVGIVGNAYQFGFIYLLSFTALISINLAIINLLPFPALDGGRLLFLLIEKIKGSRINPKIANITNMVGFYLLILLMLVITYHDVIKLF